MCRDAVVGGVPACVVGTLLYSALSTVVYKCHLKSV